MPNNTTRKASVMPGTLNARMLNRIAATPRKASVHHRTGTTATSIPTLDRAVLFAVTDFLLNPMPAFSSEDCAVYVTLIAYKKEIKVKTRSIVFRHGAGGPAKIANHS